MRVDGSRVDMAGDVDAMAVQMTLAIIVIKLRQAG